MEYKIVQNGPNSLVVETVIASGESLPDALTDALLKINPRDDTTGNYTVIIRIIKEETNNGNSTEQ